MKLSLWSACARPHTHRHNANSHSTWDAKGSWSRTWKGERLGDAGGALQRNCPLTAVLRGGAETIPRKVTKGGTPGALFLWTLLWGSPLITGVLIPIPLSCWDTELKVTSERLLSFPWSSFFLFLLSDLTLFWTFSVVFNELTLDCPVLWPFYRLPLCCFNGSCSPTLNLE